MIVFNSLDQIEVPFKRAVITIGNFDGVHLGHQAVLGLTRARADALGEQAEQILRSDQADLIAIGREALHNPNWALHAEAQLGCQGHFESWPEQYGWWLDKRQQSIERQQKNQAAA